MVKSSAQRLKIDDLQRVAVTQLGVERRATLGQFMTPSRIADFMASLFRHWPSEVRLLEPGAGVGSLVDSFADQFVSKASPGSTLELTCYEVEPLLATELRNHLESVEQRVVASGLAISKELLIRDFIRETCFALSFKFRRYTHVLLNPPYKKIGANSEYRLLLRKFGIESVNLYTSFLGLALELTQEEGEVVAIIPRSFCNGLYFRPFRSWLLQRASIEHIHVFESRKDAFRGDDILQENIIIRLRRTQSSAPVTISWSSDSNMSDYRERVVEREEVVKLDDAEQFIHIPVEVVDIDTKLFTQTLTDLGLEVSTGPVVDFRVRDFWLTQPEPECVPLLYAHHFAGGILNWPQQHKKPNALRLVPETAKWLLPHGAYTAIKRFSAKEERRRVVAHVLLPEQLPYEHYGFENHLNIIHARKQGIAPNLARGVAVFLNSTVVDRHFRTFSGHTQVNATDLRQMRFPAKEVLLKFGKWLANNPNASQEEHDFFVDSHGK